MFASQGEIPPLPQRGVRRRGPPFLLLDTRKPQGGSLRPAGQEFFARGKRPAGRAAPGGGWQRSDPHSGYDARAGSRFRFACEPVPGDFVSRCFGDAFRGSGCFDDAPLCYGSWRRFNDSRPWRTVRRNDSRPFAFSPCDQRRAADDAPITGLSFLRGPGALTARGEACLRPGSRRGLPMRPWTRSTRDRPSAPRRPCPARF